MSISYIFDWHTVEVQTSIGWLTLSTHVANSFISAAIMLWIVSSHACSRPADDFVDSAEMGASNVVVRRPKSGDTF
jgi:hypothetical protein